MSQGWESTSLQSTHPAAQKAWCSAVRRHNGQRRADTWSKGWMQNAAAGKRQLRKTQPNCSHTSTRVVVPNNHSASVADRYAQEKSPPIYAFTFTEEPRMVAPTVSHFLILLRFTPSFFLLLFFSQVLLHNLYQEVNFVNTQQQPNTTSFCCLSEDERNTLLIYKS